jgi:hypothetical protein
MKNEQRPPIPAEIKREVRQRCGFGCILCGLPLYEYEHMLEWTEVHRHVADEITLLCDRHHAEKTKGLLPKEMVAQANNNPYNKQVGVSQNYLLYFSGTNVTVTLADSVFKYENLQDGNWFAPLVIDGLAMIAFTMQQGRLFLNFVAFDEFNKPIIKIVENELVYDTKQWDIEWVGRTLTIREGKGEILLQLVLQPPTGIAISKGRILRNGIELLIDRNYIFNTNQAIFFGSNTTSNCPIGFSIGYPIPIGGGAYVFDGISRYQFDRTEALKFLDQCLSR